MVVRGRRRQRDQDLVVPVRLEAEDLGQVKDKPVSITFLILTMKDTIELSNSKTNDGVGVLKRKV